MLTAASQGAIRDGIEHLQRWLRDELLRPLTAADLGVPASLTALDEALREHAARLDATPPLDDLPLLKRALLHARRPRVESIERRAAQCAHAGMLASLDAERDALDALLASDLFALVAPRPLPRLTDWLTHESIERARAPFAPTLAPRRFDATFHQLWSDALFVDDFRYFQDRCALREAPLGVASLDLDGLRAINAAFGEQRVDRTLMPRFLTALEAHVYGRGHAYGFGRDDFALLLPGADASDATRLLTRLQSSLARLDAPGIDARPTVSIGLCVVTPDCALTAREVLARVEQAKRFAKASGRDCVAVHRDGLVEAPIEVVRR